MKVLESKFMQDFIKMADDGYKQGWHERNGGNLSYRLKKGEVDAIKGECTVILHGSRSEPRCRGWQGNFSL